MSDCRYEWTDKPRGIAHRCTGDHSGLVETPMTAVHRCGCGEKVSIPKADAYAARYEHQRAWHAEHDQ